MSTYDWSRFICRISIRATTEQLYAAWATRAGIESWFLRLSEYKNPGDMARAMDEPVQEQDSYRWRWHGWPDEVTETGTILECNGKDLFKFSFGKAGNCTITIRDEGVQGEMMVELLHDNIPMDEQGKHYWHLGCKTGWTFYLANMKSIFEGGLDLRNKNENIKEVVNS